MKMHLSIKVSSVFMSCIVMQYVVLDDNQLTGTIPNSWFKQGMMRQLSLSNNTGLT